VTVSEYAEAMKRGDEFPPVQVMHDGENHWLYDGFHRVKAAKEIRRGTVSAEVDQGTREDAIWASLAANKRHGLRRSKHDVRRAVKRAIKQRGEHCSDRQIAEHVGVSRPTVYRRRKELEDDPTCSVNKSDKRTGADGRTIDTSNIGSSQQRTNGHVDPDSDSVEDSSEQRGHHLGEVASTDGSPVLTGEEEEAHKHTVSTIGSSKSNEYFTPPKYVEVARRVMGGIDLDPASNRRANETVQADLYYDHENNGLKQPWAGRVWLNPPYGRQAGDFVSRLISEYREGEVDEAIVLVNAHSAETNWFAPLWEGLICFTDHRIDFDTAHEVSGSTHGSAFSYFGPNERAFIKEFDRFGYVARRVHPDA
jgi:DNA-binding Lrp family transcriptional regulator